MPLLLEQNFKGYANEDPGVKQQKELPIIIILEVLYLSHIELATAMAKLVCTAFFFAMQNCEYTKRLTTAEIKRTNIITLGNICFYRNNRILRHDQDIDNGD